MDTGTLVEDQIDLGKKLIDMLAETGFDVTAAFWVKASEEGSWFLYIASEAVDRLGLAAAYREVYRVFKSAPYEWDLLSEMKLTGKDNPITRDVLEIRNRFANRMATRSRRPQLGNLAIDEVYIYPPSEAEKLWPRQFFEVTYYRQGDTNTWRAVTKRSKLYRGMKAKGVVAYSTARWEGQKEGSEKFATVSVLLEVDPRFDEANVFIHPNVWEVMTHQARTMADEAFKTHHPDAVIEHGDYED